MTGRESLFVKLYKHLVLYSSSTSLKYPWSFGSQLGFFMILQYLSGIFLAFHYAPTEEGAFKSVQNIINEVEYGWMAKYIHLNGASMIFFLMYMHMGRALIYRSHFRAHRAWLSGFTIFVLTMATAFFGYILPWGQMSYWAATVITGLFTAIPLVGGKVVTFLLGSASPTGVTIARFFILHMLFAALVALMIIIHIVMVHKDGSSESSYNSSSDFNHDRAEFIYTYLYKDLMVFICFMLVFWYFVCIKPNYFNHPENFVPANPLVTPKHIVPEWYFLPFYAMLRSVPNKILGVLVMAGSLVLLAFINYLLPKLPLGKDQSEVSPWNSSLLLIAVLILLGFMGAQTPTPFYNFISALLTLAYYMYFICGFAVKIWFSKNAKAGADETYQNKKY